MNRFSFNNPIFREKRLLNFAGDVEKKEVVAKTPKEKVLDMLQKIHKVSPLVGSGQDVESVLKNNPFAHLLSPIAEKAYGKKYTIDLKDLKDGKYTLVAGSEKIVIEKLAFAAVQWPAIDKKLTELFKGKNISKKLIAYGVEKNTAPLKALILAIILDPGFNDPKTVEVAEKALDKLRPYLAKGPARSRIKMKGKIERARVKPVKLPKDLPKSMGYKAFVEKTKDRKNNPRKELDKLKMNIFREGNQINAQKWDHTTEAGLSKIYRDFQIVGIPINTPFYKAMFAILRQATDQSYNSHLATPKYRKFFQDPANHMNDIEGLPDCNSGFSPSAFAKAFQHLQYIQGLLLAQDTWQKDILSKQESLDANSIARKVADSLKSNYRKFADAIKSRDYATAGMYCVLIWGVYRAAKETGWFGKGGKGTKYLAYALAGSAAYVFAKNAGYDILKIGGFRDKTYEVKGTPLEAIDNILKANPQHRELAKDLDYRVVLQASNVPLRDLEELFQKSNKKGIQFIHPYQFSGIFPELAKEWPFKMGIGEKPFGGGAAGMAKAKLSTNQREYIRVGQQLYKLALTMRAVYNDTLKKDHPNYIGKSYEQMLKDPSINPGRVRHLLAAVYDYAPSRPKRKLTSTASIDEATGHLREAFKDTGIGFFVERQTGKSGHFPGKLMGYPVVFVRVGNSYRVYLKSDYGNQFKPGEDYIAEIPIQGGTQRDTEVKKAIEGVKRRLIELMAPLQGAGGRRLLDSSLKYRNGEWTCEVTLPGAAAFDIGARKTTAKVIPYPEGNGVTVKTEGGVVINVDELVAKQYPIGLALIPNVVSQKEFHALRFFYGAKQIQIRDVDTKNRKFALLVGRNKLKLRFTYDKANKKFILDTADEKKLLKSPTFARDYVYAIENNPDYQLNKTVEKLRLAIKTSPENFFPYVWEKLTGSGLDPQMSGINLSIFSGSVPDYLSNTVIQITKYEVLQRLRRSISSASKLEDVQRITLHTLHDVNARLEAVYDTLIAENQNIPSWKRAEYMLRILTPLRNASGLSDQYRALKGEFELSVYKLLGFLKSDLARAPHNTAGRVMEVYAYYTAHLDNHEYTYKDSTGADKTARIDLDNLASPPKASTPPIVPSYKDPKLRGYYALRYFKYVQREILTKAKGRKMKNLPDGSQKGFWGILEFEQWARTQGRPTPLDRLDNMPPFKHDAVTKHPQNKFTELEKAIVKEFDDAVKVLMRQYGYRTLKYAEIQNYLRKGFGHGVKQSQLGLFIIRSVGSGSSARNVCPLWDMAEPISHLKRRSLQIKAVHNLVEERLIKYIFQRPKRFFRKPISLKARILRKWPGLADIPLVPGWLNPLSP